MAQLVESYVQHNNHEKWKKVLKFKGRPGYPGPDWLKSFMDKNSLSLKEATKLSRAWYNATKNPFIIYNYFDLLEKTIHELGLQNRAELIWNCDESGLLHEPKKCKIISAKGHEKKVFLFSRKICIKLSKSLKATKELLYVFFQ